MTLVPLIFWTLLLVPGFAVARRWVSDELEGGLLPGLAVSWMSSFIVLAPVIAILYLLHLPIWVPVVLVALFIAWGAIDLIRSRAWSGVGKLLLASIGIEILLIVAELVFSARHGSILAADARVHLARIRFLYEHGLSNLDPFIATAYPYPIYHTNLHHGLFAIGSRLMGIDPLAFWFGSLPAVKLMIASGMAYLAWAVIGGRWAAWVAAVMVLVARGPISFSVYPNQLAPWFLAPVFFGVMGRYLAGAWLTPIKAGLVKLGGVALVLGMVHPLYAGFVVVIAAPIMFGTTFWRLVRRTVGVRSAFLGGLVVLVFALPFPVAGKLMTVPRKAQYDHARMTIVDAPPEELARAAELKKLPGVNGMTMTEGGPVTEEEKNSKYWFPRLIKKYDGYSYHEFGGYSWISRTLGRDFTGAYQKGFIPAWRLLVVLLGLLLGLLVLKRREVWYLVMGIFVIQAIVLIPPLCTFALIVLTAEWMLSRFSTMAFVLFIPLSMPMIAAVVESLLQRPRTWKKLDRVPALASTVRFSAKYRILLAMLTLLSIPLALAHSSHRRPYDWDFYWSRVVRPWKDNINREYRPLLRLQALYREHIPAGSVVLVDSFTGTRMAMLHDVSLVASERSSTGVQDGTARRLNVMRMMDLETEEEDRKALFEKYDVTHYVGKGEARQWVAWWKDSVIRGRGFRIFTLLEEPDLSSIWQRNFKIGLRQLRDGNYEKAVRRLEGVVVDSPKLERAWFHLGNALFKQGKVIRAIQAYANAEELDPLDSRYPLQLGIVEYEAENYTEALAAFDRAMRIAIDQDDRLFAATAMLNMGNTYFMLDYLEDALAAYEQAVELDPNYAKAREYRAAILEEIAYRNSQSEVDAGRPATLDTNTPSASPTP
ncbi:MAG: tetratricopeptide repeat protein [Phycisphaerales bacterium]|nr:tetratricopeptide repeat protein [Phycisphaerales bacterium]